MYTERGNEKGEGRAFRSTDCTEHTACAGQSLPNAYHGSESYRSSSSECGRWIRKLQITPELSCAYDPGPIGHPWHTCVRSTRCICQATINTHEYPGRRGHQPCEVYEYGSVRSSVDHHRVNVCGSHRFYGSRRSTRLFTSSGSIPI